MTILPYMSQHKLADELPLLSETAAVTAVNAMDRPRCDEVAHAVKWILRTRTFKVRGTGDVPHLPDTGMDAIRYSNDTRLKVVISYYSKRRGALPHLL